MFPEALITFRETLEAALVVGVMLAYLERSGNAKLNRHIYLGVGIGVFASVIVAVLFSALVGEFEGRNEQLFEGSVMLFASFLISWMILWMLKQEHVRQEIEGIVKVKTNKGELLGLVLFTAVAVFREGTETVIFLGAAAFSNGRLALLGALLGVAGALALAFVLFETAMRVNLRLFFQGTSVLLILFAAGLVAHSVHEFQEAGVLPEQAPLWSTKLALDQKSGIGAVARSLFGYADSPTALEAIAYLAYFAAIFAAYKNIKLFYRYI